jgi:tetratricopeptide (TPR) repeat protein
MKKALIIFFLFLSLLAFKNISYAETPIDMCFNLNKTEDYKRAIEVGELAIKKYPYNPDAYFCLGTAYYNIGELESAYENAKKAESLASSKIGLMYIYDLIGMILQKMDYSDDTLLYFSRSLSLAKDLGDTDMQAKLLNNIAVIYNHKGELDKALSYYEESLSLTTNEKDEASIYNNIAEIYGYKGNYKKAVEYFQKAIEIDEKNGDYHSVSIDKLNLGNTYRMMKDYKNAAKYLYEGLQGVIKIEDKYWVATGCLYSGRLLEDKKYKKKRRNTTIVHISFMNPSEQKNMPMIF